MAASFCRFATTGGLWIHRQCRRGAPDLFILALPGGSLQLETPAAVEAAVLNHGQLGEREHISLRAWLLQPRPA